MFLQSGIALTATGTLVAGRPLVAQTDNLDLSALEAMSGAFAFTIAKAYGGKLQSGDLELLSNAVAGSSTSWKANRLHAAMLPALSELRASDVTSDKLNINGMLKQIQAYNPAVSRADLKGSLSYLDNASVAQKQQILDDLQVNGFGKYLDGLSSDLTQMAAISKGERVVALTAWDKHPAHLVRVSSGCSNFNMAIFAVGIAAATIGVAASGGTLLLAGWGAIAAGGAWGALGAGGISAIVCGF
jgi:hypothetical protein